MIFSDADLRLVLSTGHLVITPSPDPAAIQPASIDLTLDNSFAVPARHHIAGVEDNALSSLHRIIHGRTAFDTVRPYHMQERSADFWNRFSIADGGAVIIHPGQFLLASTAESITLPADLVGRVEGKSTPARWGLIVHTTAGFIDPGFDGPITLELVNVGPFAYELHPGDPICQLSVEALRTPTTRPYNGHYQHQGRPGLPV